MNKKYQLVWNGSLQLLLVPMSIGVMWSGLVGEARANFLNTTEACGPSGSSGTPGRETKGGTNAGPTDGNGTFSLVAGCNADGGDNLGVTLYGTYTRALGQGATAMGFNTGAGKWASAYGVDANASGTGSTVMGFGSQASGLGAVSIGSAAGDGTTPLSNANSTWASGAGSIAIGANAARGAWALADNAVALGGEATAQASSAVAIGKGSSANQANSVALGSGSVADRGSAVSVGSASSQRQIVNLARGTADTDAVNVSQLKVAVNSLGGGATVNPDGTVTGPSYTVGGTTTNNVGDALTAVDGRVTNLGNQINNGTVGLVQQNPTSRNITVAQGTNGTRVSFAGTAGNRVLAGVARGAVSATSAEGINGAQLYGTNRSVVDALGGGSQVNPDGTIAGPTYSVGGTTVNNVGDALDNLDGRTANNTTAITNLGDQINNGTVGLVQQNPTSRNITIAKDTDGTQVSLAGTAGDRVLTGVGEGAIASASTEAVNGSQLYGTNQSMVNALGGGSQLNPDGTVAGPTYTVGGTTVNNVGDALSNVDGRVTNNTSAITNLGDQIDNGTVGLVQQDQSTRDITVANATDGTRVNFTGTAGDRVLAGIANGAVTATSTEAVNGSQLYGTNQSVVNALGGGSQTNPDGTIAGPTYSVGGTTVNNVGDALSNVDGRVTNNTNAITNLGDQINNGTVGLVQQDPASRNITIAKDTDGTQVSLAGTAGDRVLTGVGEGAIASASTEAVNGSQLYGTNTSVANALGGGSQVSPDGTITSPSYTVGGTTVNNVGDAIENVDGRVTNNSTAITNLGDQINNGTVGLVQQDQATRDITVANATDGTRVNFAGTAGDRVLGGVAKGIADNDGVNVSQLKGAVNSLGGGAAVNPDGTVTGPSYTVGGTTVNNVGDALSNIDGRVTNLGDQINSGTVGLVQQDATTRNITVAKDTDGTQVSFAGTAGDRLLTGVAKGAINQTSAEAVNGSQLYGTNQSVVNALGGGSQTNPDGTITGPTYSVGGTTVTNVGDAIENVDGRVTNNSTAITNLGDQINNGTVGLVQQDTTTRDITVANATDGTRVNFTGTAGDRVLTGVANGAIAATSIEAINGSQLYGTNQAVVNALGGGSQINPDGTVAEPSYTVGGTTVNNVGDALSNVDGRVTNNSTAITNLGDQINNGTVGLVQQDATTRDITVANATDGTRVNFTGTAGDRVLAGVAKGMADNDGVNVSQLKGAVDGLGGGATVNPDGTVTGPTYVINGKPVNNVGDALTSLGDTINNGEIGLVQQDATTRNITVAKDKDGRQVDLTGTEGARVLMGVANGAATVTSTEAVNGSQLYATNQSVVNALGGGSQLNPDGTISGPSYSVGGTTVSNVGDALSNIDGRVNNNSTRITNLSDQINNGTVGLVQQDATTREITVAKNNDGTRVSFTGSQGDRTLAGVANGTANNDGVNVSQLKGAVDGLGGGATVNPGGSVTGPTYIVDNRSVNNVGDAISNIDGRVISNTVAIQNLANGGGVKYLSVKSTAAAASATGADAVAVGPQSTATGEAAVAVGNGAKGEAANSVALGAGSVATRANSVSVGNTGNERSITNVAAGTEDTDAVNVSQLKQSQEGGARYDSQGGGQGTDYTSLSLGGPGGQTTTTVRNVRAGMADTDAVNVGQLQAGMGQTLERANAYTDGRIQQIRQDTWVARREARSGAATAIAMASLPQSYMPGKSVLAAAVGSFQGEGALAVGLSGVSDNGRYLYKAQASANTDGSYGVGMGAGIQW